jgi:signal transduction histidine kinase
MGVVKKNQWRSGLSNGLDVAALLVQIEAEFAPALGPNVRLDVAIAASVPAANCCREGLRNVIIQLLSNAFDALPMGGTVSLAADAKHQTNAAPTIELQVRDNGLGMGRETLRLATEPFFTTKVTGLGGLGLTVVNHFVKEAGGAFFLESKLGFGTRATLFLPAHL